MVVMVVESASEYGTGQTNCKYLFIHKKAEKMPQTLFKHLYATHNYRIHLNIHFFKTIESDCFQNNPNLYEIHPQDPEYALYGVDMSNNHFDDNQLESLIKQNSIFKYNFNLIKYLNLSNNNLHQMTSKSSKTYLDNEINSMRDNLSLEPNDPGYVLNRFFSLESLIVDNNPRLSVHFKNFVSIFPKLQVLSLNNCSSSAASHKYAPKKAHLFYLGLKSNKLSDTFVSSLAGLFIQMADLSANNISDLKALLDTGLDVHKLNLENNLITSFETSYIKKNVTELNLRYNLIQNTSASRFYSSDRRELKLVGNPLICDCESVWLLKKWRKLQQKSSLEARAKYSLLSRKRPKSGTRANDSIRLVFRRSLEELSAHLYTFDEDDDAYLQRQKRIRLVDHANMVHIADIDKLSCSFLASSIRDFANVSDGFYQTVQSGDFNYQIDYREKLVADSQPSDFMCTYHDHCRRDQCDCCDFFHCHCRSICPSKCTCYFDPAMSKNIIDCSMLNLLDIDNEQPIELATDVRFNSNSLKTIKSHSFFGFTNVKYLYLQNNRISLLEDQCFDDLRNSLRLVNLAHNHINYLSGHEFKNFTQLQILVLTNNPLKQIDRLDLFTFSYMQNLKLIFMQSVNISSDKLDFLDKITKLNSNALLRLDPRATITTTTTRTSTTATTTPSTKSLYTPSASLRPTTTTPLHLATTLDNLTNSSAKNEQISKLKNPLYLLIFILLISIFVLTVSLITIVLVRKKSSTDTKRDQYLNYVPRLMEQSDCQSDQYSDESESERKKAANIFKCHRKSTCSTDSCDSTYDGQSDSLSIPVSRSIESLNVHVYFNIIDNDYVANHLLPSLKKCATLIPEPKFILKPLKAYYISQEDTMSIDWSNESYSSYYSSIYGKRANNVNAVLMVLSENFLGYKRRASESYVSVRYKTNPNLYSASSNAYMSINRSVDGYFRKAFKIYLNNVHVWCKLGTGSAKKSNKKLHRDSVCLNESSCGLIDANYSSSAFDQRLVEKLQNYFQNSKGGGVAILVKKHLKFHQLNDLDSFNNEILVIKVPVTSGSIKKDLHVISVYQPPPNYKNKTPDFLNQKVFEYIEKKYDYFVIDGDLNAKLTALCSNKANENGKILEEFIENSRFIIVNDDSPTFSLSCRNYSSILDLFILSNNLGPFFNSFIASNDDLTSDHYPIELELGFEYCEVKKENGKKLDYKKADWKKFKKALEAVFFCFDSKDLNLSNEIITKSILDAANSAIPKFPSKKFKNSLPKNIVALIHKQCNKLTNMIRFNISKHKNEKWENFLKPLGPNPKLI
ncbi:hypothetical protein BpHYR1_051772 [Brachionus plicatilis]|uniref:Endonuclease/exonuclease/phosphatase domain-containing protein n=1 Tax=Brachionus plicatilis TaxID=10195 RepID=A0A3M7R7I5_BRAPC|nr:hypothetical protein BpHYR1_051772 [Brachionus plicatilis]